MDLFHIFVDKMSLTASHPERKKFKYSTVYKPCYKLLDNYQNNHKLIVFQSFSWRLWSDFGNRTRQIRLQMPYAACCYFQLVGWGLCNIDSFFLSVLTHSLSHCNSLLHISYCIHVPVCTSSEFHHLTHGQLIGRKSFPGQFLHGYLP